MAISVIANSLNSEGFCGFANFLTRIHSDAVGLKQLTGAFTLKTVAYKAKFKQLVWRRQ